MTGPAKKRGKALFFSLFARVTKKWVLLISESKSRDDEGRVSRVPTMEGSQKKERLQRNVGSAHKIESTLGKARVPVQEKEDRV